MKLSELKTSAPKILLLGKPASGKTLLATTVGEKGVVVATDTNIRSALMFKDKFTSDRHKIELKPAWEEDPNQAVAFSKARSYIESIVKEAIAKTCPYKVLIIDGLTNLAEDCMRAITGPGSVTSRPVPTQPMWNFRDIDLMSILNTLRAAPLAVVMIAHVIVEELNGLPTLNLALAGRQLPPKFFQRFDEVWGMDVRKTADGLKFCLVTQPDGAWPCRSSAQLPNLLDTSIGLPAILKQIGYEL